MKKLFTRTVILDAKNNSVRVLLER